MGRRRLSRADGSDSSGRAPGAGYDQPPDQVQELYRRSSQAQEYDQGQSQVQGGASISYSEAYLRIYKGALPGLVEEPPVALRGLRAGEPVPTPHPAGPSRGVVPLEAGKLPSEIKKTSQDAPISSAFCPNSAGNPPRWLFHCEIGYLRRGSLADRSEEHTSEL